MTKHFLTEIELLKKEMVGLCTLVEESVHRAVKSVLEIDYELATQVIDNDTAIDDKEVELEEDCLKILALYQPVAADLRFVVAVLKLNHDLERIGDLAVNIAYRAQMLFELPKIRISWDFASMADKVKLMLRKCIQALINKDIELAKDVMQSDQEIDELNRGMFREIQAAMQKNPDQLPSLLNLIIVSRSLERIADHTTNIAEDVFYLVRGEIIRHGRVVQS